MRRMAVRLWSTKKGGTPQPPQGGGTGGTPVPEGERQHPQWALVAMGGAAKRQRAGRGAAKAT